MLAVLLGCIVTMTYEERQIDFVGEAGLAMHGTFSAPVGAEKVPAVLLLPGSGPTDRDGNQPPALKTELLRQIATYLAEHGVASLRFDKRAAHVHAADWPKDIPAMNIFFGWDRFVGDAEAAFKTLKEQKEVDSAKVGIFGHSEGGLITLQLAATSQPAFMILAGTPVRPMADIVREQVSEALKAQLAPKNIYDQYMGSVDRCIKQITKSATVPDNVEAGLRALFNPTAALLMQSYFKLNVPALLKTYSGPVLVINGEFDNQVSAERDAKVLGKLLSERKAGRTKLVIIEKASHNLKRAKGLRDSTFEGPVEPAVLTETLAWCKGN